MRKQVTKLMMMAALLGLGIAGAATHGNSSYTDAEVAKKLAHEIRMYSRYSIWDNINFRVNEGNVELLGQVNQPYKKADLTRRRARQSPPPGRTNTRRCRAQRDRSHRGE